MGFLFLLLLTQAAGLAQDLHTPRFDSAVASEDQIRIRLMLAHETSKTDIREALNYAYRALSEAENIGSRRYIAESKLAIGTFYDFLGVNEEAVDQLMEAFDLFVELDDSVKQANAIQHIGNAYYYLEHFSPALRYFRQVSDYGRSLKDTSLIISGINATAAVYGNTDKLDSALILFQEARSLSKKIGSLQQEILAYYNIGDVYLYSGRRGQALQVFQELEESYDLKMNSPKHLSSLYNSMTKAYLEKGDLERARSYSDKTYEALLENSRLTEQREYYLNRYRIDSAEENTALALAHFIRFKELSDSLNNSSFEEKMANLGIFFELQAKENQIERLTLDNQFKDLKIRQKRLINIAIISVSLLMLLVFFLTIRSFLKTREKNILLERQKEELKAAQQLLVQSEKMASIGTLTAGIAHEINNPLNFISGGLNLLKDMQVEMDWEDEKDRERCETATKMAFDGLNRSVQIVKALMTFSHRGGLKKEKADLHEIIDNTLMFLKSKIADDITVIRDYQIKDQIMVYPEKMHQVIMNILDNAVYAVRMKDAKARVITISTRKNQQVLELSISNTGPAIPEDQMNRLFDPFFTTKEPGKGTGLGLSISYSLVEEHGGSLMAENIPGGVRFRITLPL